MVEVVVLCPIPILLAAAAMHVATDLGSPSTLWPYLLLAFDPPALAISAVTCLAVAFTIIRDIGGRATIGAALAYATLCAWNPDTATAAASVYYAFFHTPLHYRRCGARGQWMRVGIALWASVLVAASVRVARPTGKIVLSHSLQKFMTCHTLVQWISDTRASTAKGPKRSSS